jgi:hypothetical protein
MLDKSEIYAGYIWDISRIYTVYIYIPDKSWIYPKYIPEYILNISGIYSQIYLGFQGWGVRNASFIFTIGVQRGVSKRMESGRRLQSLRADHSRNGHEAVSAMACLYGVEGSGMAGPGETLGTSWPPLPIRP